MALRAGRVGMDVQLAEQPAECLVLVERQLLVAEEDHLVRHQRIVHLLELLIAERLARSIAGDLRADGRRGRLHLDRSRRAWKSSLATFAWNYSAATAPTGKFAP